MPATTRLGLAKKSYKYARQKNDGAGHWHCCFIAEILAAAVGDTVVDAVVRFKNIFAPRFSIGTTFGVYRPTPAS